MMKVAWVTVVVVMLIVGVAEALRSDICHSSHVPGTFTPPLTNDTTFSCPSLGVVTIPQVYQIGGRVIQLTTHLEPNVHDPVNSQIAWLIVIEFP